MFVAGFYKIVADNVIFDFVTKPRVLVIVLDLGLGLEFAGMFTDLVYMG